MNVMFIALGPPGGISRLRKTYPSFGNSRLVALVKDEGRSCRSEQDERIGRMTANERELASQIRSQSLIKRGLGLLTKSWLFRHGIAPERT